MDGLQIPDSTIIPEGPSGVYQLEFYRPPGALFTVDVSVESGGITVIESFTPDEPCPLTCTWMIPTLGQWGLILLGMLMLLFVTITVQFRETSRQKMLSKIKAQQSSILRMWLVLSIIYLALIAPLFVFFEVATLWDLPFGIIMSLIVSIWWQIVKMSTQNQKIQTAVG